MALPSQVQRNSVPARMYRPGASRSTRPWLRPVAIGVLALAGIAAVWGLGRILPFAKSSDAKTPGTGTTTQVAGVGLDSVVKAPDLNLTGTPSPTPAPETRPAPSMPDPAPPAAPVGSPTTGAEPDTTAPGAEQADPTKPQPVDVSNPNGTITRPATTPASAPGGPALPPNPTLTPEDVRPATSPVVLSLIGQGDTALKNNKLVEARTAYSRALLAPGATSVQQDSLRSKLKTINDDLVFSSKIIPGDPLVTAYTVENGDNPVKIAKKQQLATDYRLIARINRIDPKRLNVDRQLKLVRGPFHVVVHKSDYRGDVFAGSPDEPESWLYIRSFTVGLGEGNSTPVGQFIVKKGSKLINPPWTNPRTGEHFGAEDPKNPIGEHWIGLEGVGASASITGYGLHGTIDPDSIGKQKSMGCVRLHAEDIELLYELLVEEISVVKIVP